MLTPEDQSHLKALSICWYVMAGLQLIGGLCGGLYMVIGVIMGIAASADGDEDAALVGFLFVGGLGLLMLLIFAFIALLSFLTAKGLAHQRRSALIYVMSALACMNVPLGTVLGVFTFIVMGRDTVKDAFAAVRDGYDPNAPQQADPYYTGQQY